jgi:predicted Zn-dependent protease
MVQGLEEWNRVRSQVVFRILCLILAIDCAVVHSAVAQESGTPDSLSFIRDAEIEDTILTWWTPILKAASLDPAAVHIYLVNNPELNAFVAGGQNLFLFTGTLMRSKRPNQVVGIMAHETGHIAGGHLSRFDAAMHNASIEGIIAMAVGAALGAMSRNPGAAAAGMLGGAGVGERSFLQFSITQEASADHAALTFLDRSHQSARGLLEFFQILEGELVLSAQHEDPYLRTHPLTRDRINYVKEHVDQSPWSDVPDPPDWIVMHQRMVAKLGAFLGAPSQVLAQYKPDDHSLVARYARAIAYYRIPQLQKALDEVNGLIADNPRDPYFEELKGQMLFENGHIAEALAPYQQAVALKPDNALLMIELAQVQLESNDPALVPKALALLNRAKVIENDNADLWRLFAIAYGQQRNIGMMAVSLAEQGMANGDYRYAGEQAGRAIKLLPPGIERQRAQDIADDARRSRDKE